MSTTYKAFLDDDIVTARTMLHEYVPVTSSILSNTLYSGNNFKSYTHGMFQSVYDYPHTSSAANHLFDLTVGITSDSPASSSLDASCKRKINMYNQMAQTLVGFDTTGSIMKFDRDGDQSNAISDDKYNTVFVVNFSRLLTKDEIKKNSFNLTLGVGETYSSPFTKTILVSDVSASESGNYRINSPTGEYGILYAQDINGNSYLHDNQNKKEVGLVFYQAGMAIISANVFAQYNASNSPTASLSASTQGQLDSLPQMSSVYSNVQHLIASGTISDACDSFRSRVGNLTLSNTTELNSTIHFCRVSHNEFNYSSNPTYLSSSQMIVKNVPSDSPISYITTVGLYSPDNELLAVAKLSEPIRKDPTTELILRVRLDY